MPAITAAARSQTALNASTSLSPDEVLAIVKQAGEDVKGSGFGRRNGKFVKSEVRPRVIEDHVSWLRIDIGSGWESATPWTVFTAVADKHQDGLTTLKVGGLEKYKTLQSKIFGLIPSRPASIINFGLYKRYLGAIEARLRQADPQATITIGTPQV